MSQVSYFAILLAGFSLIGIYFTVSWHVPEIRQHMETRAEPVLVISSLFWAIGSAFMIPAPIILLLQLDFHSKNDRLLALMLPISGFAFYVIGFFCAAILLGIAINRRKIWY